MLHLHNDDLHATLLPAIGGGFAQFQAYGQDVFRRAEPAVAERSGPLELACFPMAPYVNRIAGGAFEFLGRMIALRSEWAPHALHGFGWREAWQIVDQTQRRVRLAFEAEAGEWPWRYRCEQLVTLEGCALVVDLSIENLDELPMPVSLGLHPYFLGADEAELQASADGVWLTDDELIPLVWKPLNEAPAIFRGGRPVRRTNLDNCYTGFDGAAHIVWPRRRVRVRLEAPACRFLQVYTRGSDNSFCVEAQTAMPDALNQAKRTGRHETGIKVLSPGERMSCLTRFAVSRF
jgi:aldose 1-epimerase